MITALLWALIGGSLVGVLGKLVAPGSRDEVPLWLTVLCGIGGALAGAYLYGMLFEPPLGRVDWWRHVWQLAGSAVLVAVAAGTTGHRHA